MDDRNRLTVCVSHPSLWKRDALLFHRIYVPLTDAGSEAGAAIPDSVRLQDEEADRAVAGIYQQAAFGFALGGGMPDESFRRSTSPVERPVAANALVAAGLDTTLTYESSMEFYKDFAPGVQLSYDGALGNLPLVKDDVDWDQIVEFRSDPDSTRKYRDLRLWLHKGLEASSVDEAVQTIGQMVDDYRWAIEKHGLSTRTGVLSELFGVHRSAATAAAALGGAAMLGEVGAALVGGLALTSQVVAQLSERRIDLTDLQRGENREVAILYDAIERFDKTSPS